MRHRNTKKITVVDTPIEELMRPIADAYIQMWNEDQRPYGIMGLNGTEPFFQVLENILDREGIPVGEMRFRIKREDLSILSPSPADIQEKISELLKRGKEKTGEERPLHFILKEDSSRRHIDARALRDGIEALAAPSSNAFTPNVKNAVKTAVYTYFAGSDLGGGHPDFKLIATQEAIEKESFNLDTIENNYRIVHNTNRPLTDEDYRRLESSLAKAGVLAGKIYNDNKTDRDRPVVIMCEEDDEPEAKLIRDKLRTSGLKSRVYVLGKQLKENNEDELQNIVFRENSTIIQYKYSSSNLKLLSFYEKESKRLGIEDKKIDPRLHFALCHSRIKDGLVDYFVTREDFV